MIKTRLIAAAFVLFVPALGAADDRQAETDDATVEGTSTVALLGSARSKVENSMLMAPGTSELGGALKLVAGGVMADGRELSLTDLSLLHLHARRALGDRFEIAGGVNLLLKEPDRPEGSEPVLQGASLGLRMAVGTRYAVAARAQAGPQIGSDHWGEALLLAQARRVVHETMVFEGAIGGAHTALLGDDSAFITEAVVGGDVMIRTPRGEFGIYGGLDYRIPVVSSDALDAPVRLSVAVGSVYAVVPTWDLFVEAAVIDRGDVSVPATTLPILDGGRDQRQIVVGVAKHFADGDDHTVSRASLAY